MSSTQPTGITLVPAAEPAALPAPVEKRIDALVRAARRVRHSQNDDDAIHDARVASRRLTALLDVWIDQMAPRPRQRARRALARLRRRLGPARENEVNLARVEKLASGAPPAEAEALARIATRLRGRQEEDRAEAASASSRDRVDRIADRVRKAVRGSSPTAWDSSQALAAAAERVERRREAALDALMEALAEPTDAALHAARVAAKKWRYGAEALGETSSGAEPEPAVSALRALQVALGAIQDRAVLARLLEREARRAARRADVACLHALLERSAALRSENQRARTGLASLLDQLSGGSADAPPA